jgi:hypothetical protein
MASERVNTIVLTDRQVTLVRVGLILRLQQLMQRINNGDTDLQIIYDETRAMLLADGPLSIDTIARNRRGK